MLSALRGTCCRTEMGVYFAAPNTSPCHSPTLRLGERGGLGLDTSCRSMGVYFADTGYQNTLQHGCLRPKYARMNRSIVCARRCHVAPYAISRAYFAPCAKLWVVTRRPFLPKLGHPSWSLAKTTSKRGPKPPVLRFKIRIFVHFASSKKVGAMVLFLQCTARAAKRLGDRAAGPGGRAAGRPGGRAAGRSDDWAAGRPSGWAAERKLQMEL